MLVCLGITAIDKSPLQVRFDHKRLENLDPLARGRPGIEALVNSVPAAKRLRQISPGTACAYPVEHGLDGHAQIRLVVDGLLQQNLMQLRPMLVTEHRGIENSCCYCMRALTIRVFFLMTNLRSKRQQTLEQAECQESHDSRGYCGCQQT
ncbi:hypothetical protein SAMN05216403_10636 [Nitrosospira multiformis ATCC 25196]|uniref:Uncharacterized protein n=1 Tax=Nitrosospira multiformis (strain ATCC 25196 / NCIMB 11849 / C 71) TaxID=323848 RepID=A0A1H5U2C6_NITMU|nr:hypothetical protein SAMN05216403_10636 [Nitrosospira multiformis ATCC 25196]